jgi:hypothetical protein
MVVYDIVNHFFMAGNMEEINFYSGKGLGLFGAEEIIEFEYYLI